MKAKIKETGETIEGFLDGRGHFDVPVDHCIFDRYNVEELELEENGNPILLAASDLVDAVERYMRQECLRSELMLKKDKLKALLHD